MRDCTIYVAKTKALINFAVTAKLICVFVFAYAKRWFSHDTAHMVKTNLPEICTFEWIFTFIHCSRATVV